VVKRSRSFFLVLLVVTVAHLSPRATLAQTSSDLVPTTVAQCQPGGCGTWTFQGKRGIGRWTTGAVANLTIEHFDDATVSIYREDTTGVGKGIKGHYAGTRKGDRIEGTFTWVWPGGPFPNGNVNWYAVIQRETREPERKVPSTIAMCEDSDGCSTWSFEGREGHGQWSNGASANLTAERFGADTVLIRRTDTSGLAQGLTAFYSGTRKGDRIEGTVIWSWSSKGQYLAGTTNWHGEINPAQPPATSGSLDRKTATASAAPSKVEPSQEQGGANPYPTPPKSAAGYPPPPAGTPSELNGRKAAYDLNGAWGGYFDVPGIPVIIRIHHDGLHLSAELLHDDFTPLGQPFFRGELDDKTFTAKIEVAGHSLLSALTASQPDSWSPGDLGVLDPDHVQIGKRPAFQRMTMPRVNDIPCESTNHFQVQGTWALFRGKQAHDAKDFAKASCWFYVAAVQGDAKAQWFLSYYLHDGIGAPKNVGQAFQWARKSGENGDDYGASTVALMYEKGDGTPADPAKAGYWRARGKELYAQKEKEAAADKAQEQQFREGVNELLVMGAIGEAVLTGELNTSSSGGANTSDSATNSERSRQASWITRGGAASGPPPGWKPNDPIPHQ
jgi:hypothetical protein